MSEAVKTKEQQAQATAFSDNGALPKIGIAMIARNAAKMIPLALDPLLQYVDEVAIVLGGISDDETPKLATEYATLPVEQYDGPMLENGRIGSFAHARQQSFDILKRAGINYALVVDCDDQWANCEKLPDVLSQAHSGHFPMTLFPYKYEGGSFLQPRLYRIDSGHWDGPCHNFWEVTGEERVALQTDWMEVRQERPAKEGDARRGQNVLISETWMAEHGEDCRLLQHMAKDLMVDGDYDRVREILERYFKAWEADTRRDPEEYYQAWHTLATVHLIQERYGDALHAAMMALSTRTHGQSWTLAAEAAGFLARTSRNEEPLLKLSEWCAEQAILAGKPRHNLHWHADRMNAQVPLLIRIRALMGLGKLRDALGLIDILMAIAPDCQEGQAMRRDVCRALGELE